MLVHCCELKTRLLQEPCSTMPTEVVSTLSMQGILRKKHENF